MCDYSDVKSLADFLNSSHSFEQSDIEEPML